MIELSDEQDLRPALADALCERAEQILSSLGMAHAIVSLVLCDNETIRGINMEWRQKDAPTDVLSFPMLEEALLPYLEGEEPWPDDLLDAEQPPLLLGDIVISVEMTIQQAAEWGHDELDEATRLWIHGFLHLCGYDHEEEEDALCMRQREEVLLASVGASKTAPLTTHPDD